MRARASLAEAGAGPAELAGELGQEVPRERLEILRPFTQRCEPDPDHVQAEVEVLPESSRADRLLEILVGGRDDADVGAKHPGAAETMKLLVLEHAQELGLGGWRHVADLVEEESAAVRLLEASDSHAVGRREGAALVPEELGLQQRLGERGAVHLHEGCRGPGRVRVNDARDELLAGPRLPGHQNGGAGRRHAPGQVQCGPQGLARPHDPVDAQALRPLLAQGRDLADQTGVAASLGDPRLELLELEGLLDEVEGSELHRLDGGLYRSVGSHEHHRDPGIALPSRTQDVDSAGAGEAEIGHHHVVGFDTAIAQPFHGFVTLRYLVHGSEALAERPGNAAPERGVVLHQKDPDYRHEGSSSTGSRTQKVLPAPGPLSTSMDPP